MYYSRKAWGAKVNSGWGMNPKKNLVILHYSTGQELGNQKSVEWVRSIEQFHVHTRGWTGIAYNFLVDWQGNVFEGRGWDAIGAHCKESNSKSIGICFLGNDDPNVQDVTQAARVSIKQLVDKSIKRYGSITVDPHSRHRQTECPGDEIRLWITQGLPINGIEPANGWSGRILSFISTFGGKTMMQGRDVLDWQMALKALGYDLQADGIFGPETERRTVLFQQQHHLPSTGKVDQNTWDTAIQARPK